MQTLYNRNHIILIIHTCGKVKKGWKNMSEPNMMEDALREKLREAVTQRQKLNNESAQNRPQIAVGIIAEIINMLNAEIPQNEIEFLEICECSHIYYRLKGERDNKRVQGKLSEREIVLERLKITKKEFEQVFELLKEVFYLIWEFPLGKSKWIANQMKSLPFLNFWT